MLTGILFVPQTGIRWEHLPRGEVRVENDELASAVAVGWLDSEFIGRLFEACSTRAVARTRGWHRCPLCPAQREPTTARGRGKSLSLGDSEIRVVADDGTWLIAPTPVLHNIAVHVYQPPRAFVDTISAGRFAPLWFTSRRQD